MAARNSSGTRRRALLLAALALMGAVVVGLRSPAAWEATCTLARRELPALLGLEVGLGRCELDPLGQRLVVYGLSLFEPGAEEPLLVAEQAEVQLGLVLPWGGRVSLDALKVRRPRLRLDLSRPRASSEPRPCALASLQRLRIARLDIHEAQVRLALPEGRQVEVGRLEVSWRERWGVEEFEVEAQRGLVRLGGGLQELPMGRLVLAGGLDLEEELLELDEAEVTLGELSVRASGRVEQLCEPVLALDAQLFLPLRMLRQVGLVEKPVEGHLWSRVQVYGRPEAPRAVVEAAGRGLRYGTLAPDELTARFTYAAQRVVVESLVMPVGEGGEVRAAGSLGLSPTLPLELELVVSEASFARILEKGGVPGSWVDFPATGRVRLAGSVLPRLQLEGAVELRNGRFVLATRPYDAPVERGRTLLTYERGRASARVRLGPDRFSFSDVVLESAGSRVQGEATLFNEPGRGLEVRGEAELALEDFGAIAELPWAGHGTASFEVKGPYGALQSQARLALRDFELWGFSLGTVQGNVSYQEQVLSFPSFSGQKGRTPYYGNAALTFGRSLHARAEVEVPRGRTEDLVDMLAGLHPNMSLFEGTLSGAASGRVEVDSPLDQLEGLVAFDLKDTTYYGRRLGEGALRLRFVDGQAVVLERTELLGPLGLTWAEGTWRFDDGGLAWRFGGEGLSLAELAEPSSQELGLEGTLEVQGRVGGTTDALEVEAELSSSPIVLEGRDLGRLELQAYMQGRDLYLTGSPLRGLSCSRLFLRVREPYAYEADCLVELPELRPLLPQAVVAQRLGGSLRGALHAQGMLRQSSSLQASAWLERLSFARGDLAVENEGPLLLSYSGGRLQVPPFTLRGKDMELSAEGQVSPGELDMVLRGTFGVRLLESFVPGLARTGGQVEVNAVARGSPRHPSLVGSILISGGELALRDQPVSLQAMSGRLEFSEQRLLIEHLEGVLNEGRVQAQGGVRLESFNPTEVDLGLNFEGVNVRVVDELPFTSSGRLTLSGRREALALGGKLVVRELLYRKSLELEDILRRFSRRSLLPPTSERPREFLNLDVDVELEDARVDNNLARAGLKGKLRLTGTNARLGVLGMVDATEGSQVFFRNNPFLVTHAYVEFTDRYAIDPAFDLRAQSLVRGYLVKLHAFGRPDDPQIILSSEPLLSEPDILALLTLGVTSTDRDEAADASASLAAEAIFNASGLDRQAQRFLPTNPLLKDLSLQISTGYNPAIQQIEPIAHLESKFLTEQLKVEAAYPASGRGTRARAEYRFDNSLSGQLQWDNENNRTPLGNMGLELKLSWETD